MGKISHGILGAFKGKVGPVVGSTHRGEAVVKSRPTSLRNPRTPAQQAQRQRFALVTGFFRTARPMVELGFTTGTARITSVNAAVSYNIRNGITGEFPDQGLDYPALLVCRGSLSGVKGAVASATEPGRIELTWADNTGRGSAGHDDAVLVMVYNAAQQEPVFSFGDAHRADTALSLALPDDYTGEELHVWMAFRNAGGSATSDSTYVAGVVAA